MRGDEAPVRTSFGDPVIPRLSHLNMWLLPLAAMARLRDRIFPGDHSIGSAVPAAVFNRALYAIFRSKRHLVSQLNLSAGASLRAVIRRD